MSPKTLLALDESKKKKKAISGKCSLEVINLPHLLLLLSRIVC